MTIVDAHVHLYRRASEEYPRVVLDVFPRDAEAPAEDLLELMDSHGVDRAVVVALGPQHRYLGDCVRNWPDRFVGIGVVVADDPAPSVTFRRLRDDIGVWGMRAQTLGPLADNGALAKRTSELLGTLERAAGPLWFYGGEAELGSLDAAATRFPGLSIALNHLAFFPSRLEVDEGGNRVIDITLPPPTIGRVAELARRHPNLFVVVSGQYAFSRQPYPHPDLGSTLAALLDAFGAERMLWGSDYPASGPAARYGDLARLPGLAMPDLSEDQRRAIMGGTAARLIGLSR